MCQKIPVNRKDNVWFSTQIQQKSSVIKCRNNCSGRYLYVEKPVSEAAAHPVWNSG
jgi:hypothetical protein